ncbi:MAG: hypothetical protein WC787_03585 [Patescibacteria group bacterium]|jgi:predicted TIM-barrel enzyme
MPPSTQDLKHLHNVMVAYKATLQNIVSTHKKRVKKAMQEVDVEKVRAIREEVRQNGE